MTLDDDDMVAVAVVDVVGVDVVDESMSVQCHPHPRSHQTRHYDSNVVFDVENFYYYYCYYC